MSAAVLAGTSLAGCAKSTSPSPGGGHPGSSAVQPTASTSAGSAGDNGFSSPAITSSKNPYTYDYGNARDGVGPATPSLERIGTSPSWTDALPGGVYGQPLVVGNQVIVGTEDDEVFGVNGSSGAVKWHFSIGSPVAATTVRSTPGLSGCGDIFPLGITGTPVVIATGATVDEIFVAGEVQRAGTSGWHGVEHVLAAATFSSAGATIRWTREIDPPGAGSTYLIPAEQQRSSLTLSGGKVYVEYGGLSGDCGRYQGYVVGVPAAGSGPTRYFRVPTSREGAIWSTGGAAVGPTGELYVATGNSANESPTQKFDYGDAVIGLSSKAGGFKIDSYFRPRIGGRSTCKTATSARGDPSFCPGEVDLRDRKDPTGRREHRLPARPCGARGARAAVVLRDGLPERRVCVRGERLRSAEREREERHLRLRALPVRHCGARSERHRGSAEVLNGVGRAFG